MRHDLAAALYYGDGNLDHYRDYGLVAVDPAEPGRPVARAFSAPFGFPDLGRGREALPADDFATIKARLEELRRERERAERAEKGLSARAAKPRRQNWSNRDRHPPVEGRGWVSRIGPRH